MQCASPCCARQSGAPQPHAGKLSFLPPFLLSPSYVILTCLFVIVGGTVTHVEGRGQLGLVSSRPSVYRSWGQVQEVRLARQVPLPTEPPFLSPFAPRERRATY